MSRNLVRSDYNESEISWLDWIVAVSFLLIGLWELLIANNLLLGALLLAAGLGFGFFITVGELGQL